MYTLWGVCVCVAVVGCLSCLRQALCQVSENTAGPIFTIT